MINKIKCWFKEHKFVNAGTCPFTGRTYNACTNCGKMVAI